MTTIRVSGNNQGTTLNGAITALDTSITVTNAAGFPTITSDEFYNLTIDDDTTVEIITVTSVSSNVLTVTRGAEGTSAAAFVDATVIELRPTADSVDRKAEQQFTYSQNNTGLISGGSLSIGTVTSTFDVEAGTAMVVDAYTDPLNPVLTPVSWDAFSAVAVTDIATEESTLVYINASSSLIQQQTETATDIRTLVFLGNLIHSDNTIIDSVINVPILSTQAHSTLVDFYIAVGLINLSGNVYSANGVNLNIDKTVGSTFGGAINWANSQQIPNTTTDALATTVSFVPIFQDGSGGITVNSATTTIDTNFYDDGTGTLAAMPTNDFAVHRIIFNPTSAVTSVEYAQETYGSLEAAESAIATQSFIEDDVLAEETTLRSFLIFKEGATDLSDATEAQFITASKSRLGTGASTGGGSAGADAALSNLSTVAINTSLISDTANTDDLGSTSIPWKDLYTQSIVTSNAVIVSATDKVLIQDTSDSDALATVTTQSIADLAAGGGSGGRVFIETQTVTAASVISFNTGIDSTYDKYIIELSGIRSAVNDRYAFRTSANTGTSYDSGTTDYEWNYAVRSTDSSTQSISNNVGDDTIMFMAQGVGNDSGDSMMGTIIIDKPHDSTLLTLISFDITIYTVNNTLSRYTGIGFRDSIALVDAFQVRCDLGSNFSAGRATLYGLAHS